MSELADAIRAMAQEKGVSEDSIRQTIENTLKVAYKRTFGSEADNAIVTFSDDLSSVNLYARKTIVDGVFDPVKEIDLEDALERNSECALGDEIDIPIDPKKDFERSAVGFGKQIARQGFSESYKTSLYDEYKDKVGEMIIGYYQRQRNNNIYVDLGKVEGVLPGKFQSPIEVYKKGDRIKSLIVGIKKTNSSVQLVLSRTDEKIVRRLLEQEVPEISENVVEIHNVVRDPGYRTKIAVSSVRDKVDAVGSCVGPKGVRIQTVIRELNGEKIDVLEYSPDPVQFIKNALSPAEVLDVKILDEQKKTALAIVEDKQFSLAIGKKGQNVRLANRLCDWTIDVKTEEQAAEMDLSEFEARKAAASLFNDDAPYDSDNNDNENVENAAGSESAEKFDATLADSSENVAEEKSEETLAENNIDNSQPEQKSSDKNASTEDDVDDGEEYFCPECGARITLGMTHCPNCHVEIVFE
ncbi:MAG: transcription termination factor NusA [Treponema sp.]|nr:transcription termination factor NusA [Treponema sp.]